MKRFTFVLGLMTMLGLDITVGVLAMCDESTRDEVTLIIEAMERTINMFSDSKDDLTADVILGLIITKEIMQGTPNGHLWDSEIKQLQDSADELIIGFMKNEFGNHELSSQVITFMLNPDLWKQVVQPREQWYFSYDKRGLINEKLPKYAGIGGGHSDQCLQQLFMNNCWVSPDCLINTDYPAHIGYGTTHLLLFLQMATVLDCPRKNNLLFKNQSIYWTKSHLCRLMLQHAQEAIRRKLSIDELDVLLEEITLCGLEGDQNFDRKEIRKNVLAYENEGCFKIERIKRNDSITKKGCHTHTAAVGLTAMAVFLRFLLQQIEIF